MITVTGRDGIQRTVSINTNGSLADVVSAFNNHASGMLGATLNRAGTGITISDRTGGTGNLIIEGQTATSLGIATDPAGVASSTVKGGNLQHQYVTRGTLLSSLRSGQGIGTGGFRITDSTGVTAQVNVETADKTIDDLIKKINSRPTRVRARINQGGDGIELYEETAGAGNLKIKVADESGTVAANLNIKGEATGVGAENVINGSFERKITFGATDTLQQVADKISAAGVGVAATIINNGVGSTPFRLSLAAKNTGSAGRFTIDTGEFDLGESQLDRGQDARVFFGSSDPARGVLLTSSKNTLDSVIAGVTIDLKSVSTNPVTLTVTRNTGAIETAVNTFVSAFNTLTGRIKQLSTYNVDTKTRGVLLGDPTGETIRSGLFAAVQGKAVGINGSFDQFADVGLTVGQGGELKLDRDKLRQALETDPQGVADLFAARVQEANGPTTVPGTGGGVTTVDPNAPAKFSSLGIASVIENLSDSYISSVNGLLTRRGDTITGQIEQQNQRIAAIDARLLNRRGVLERQFLAMEQAIGRLQGQQNSLGQITQIG